METSWIQIYLDTTGKAVYILSDSQGQQHCYAVESLEKVAPNPPFSQSVTIPVWKIGHSYVPTVSTIDINGKKVKLPVNFDCQGQSKLNMGESGDKKLIALISEQQKRIQQLELNQVELEQVLSVLIKRVYGFYPINIPEKIVHAGVSYNIIPYSKYEQYKNDKQVESVEIEPLLQPYAGSHRRNNRMICAKLKSGETFLTVAKVDEEGKITPPDV